MAKSKTSVTLEPDDFYASLVKDAIDAPRVGSAPNNVEYPKVIGEHVAELAKLPKGHGKLLNVTDAETYEHIRSLYASAARDIGMSATVRKHPSVESWTHTRVSVGDARGTRPKGAESTTDGVGTADDVQNAAQSVSENRGW